MSTPKETVAVTGASGFVGRAVVRELLARGYGVRALVRDRDKARKVLPADRRVLTVLGDAGDDAVVKELVAGAQAVVHLIGIIRAAGGGQSFQRVHVGTTRTLLDAARAAGIKRFVHMSALGVHADGKAEYQRTKFEGEQLVRRSGLDWTVFRPGLIHGADGELVGMIKGWCEGTKQPFVLIPYFARVVEHNEGVILGRISFESAQVAPVYVGDVARCFVAALTNPRSVGEVYNLVGSEELSFRDMLRFYRDKLPGADATLPIAPVPGPAAVAQAVIAKAVGLGGALPFDEGQAHMAQEDQTADLSKVRAHFGLGNDEPRGFRAAAADYVGSLV
jgi:NADH dehydrogenase